MTYEVYLDDQILYYPDDDRHVIVNARLSQALNDSGEFEFEVPVSNPLYENIMPRRSMIQVMRDGKEIFYGEVREAEEKLYQENICGWGVGFSVRFHTATGKISGLYREKILRCADIPA